MYRCDTCQGCTELGQKINRIVVETRPKIYTAIYRDQKTRREQEIEIGRGTEVVREIKVCGSCAARLEAAMSGDGSTHRMVINAVPAQPAPSAVT